MEKISLHGNGCHAMFKVKDRESERLKEAIINNEAIYEFRDQDTNNEVIVKLANLFICEVNKKIAERDINLLENISELQGKKIEIPGSESSFIKIISISEKKVELERSDGKPVNPYITKIKRYWKYLTEHRRLSKRENPEGEERSWAFPYISAIFSRMPGVIVGPEKHVTLYYKP